MTPASQRFKQDITLPSGGYSDTTTFPGGKLTVYPWDMGTSEWMAAAPKANELSFMAQLVARLTHLSVDKVKNMVSSELPLVAMVARALTFDNSSISYYATCPHCRTVQPKTTLQIPAQLEKVGEKPQGYTGDSTVLPVSQDSVVIRPITVNEEEGARNRPDKFQKLLGNVEATALAAVRSIGGGTPDTQDELVRWYRALAPADAEFLITEVARFNPGVNNSVKHACENTTCAREFTYELNLATDFFRH